MRSSFKVDLAEFRTCGSREQCTGSNQKNTDAWFAAMWSTAIQTQPKSFVKENFTLSTR